MHTISNAARLKDLQASSTSSKGKCFFINYIGAAVLFCRLLPQVSGLSRTHDVTQNRTSECCPGTCTWSLIPDSVTDKNLNHGQTTFLNVPLFPLFSPFISPLSCFVYLDGTCFFHSYFCADHFKVPLISIKIASAVNCWLLKYYKPILLQYHCKA